MWQNFIGKHVRRTNRNLLVVNLFIVVALALTLAGSWDYLAGVFGTPPALTAEQAGKLRLRENAGHIVRVSGTQSFSSGFQWVKDGRVEYEFIVLDTGANWILVKGQPSDAGRTQFTGSIELWPGEIREKIIAEIRKKDPSAADPFVGYIINANDYQRPGWIGLAIGVPLFLMAVWNLDKWRRRRGDINIHPAVAALKVAGQPWQVAQQLQGELATAKNFGKLQITATWLLYPTFFSLHVRRLQDLLWVHGKVVRHYTYFIPTGKTWAVIVHDRKGALQMEVKNEQMMKAVLEEILARVPYVIAGHSQELESLYNSKRAEFIAAVEARRNQAKPATASS